MRFRVIASLGIWLRRALRISEDSRHPPAWLSFELPSCPVSRHLRGHLTLLNVNFGLGTGSSQPVLEGFAMGPKSANPAVRLTVNTPEPRSCEVGRAKSPRVPCTAPPAQSGLPALPKGRRVARPRGGPGYFGRPGCSAVGMMQPMSACPKVKRIIN